MRGRGRAAATSNPLKVSVGLNLRAAAAACYRVYSQARFPVLALNAPVDSV